MLRKIAKIIKQRKRPEKLRCLVGLHGKKYKPAYWRYIWWLIRQEFITPCKLEILSKWHNFYNFCTYRDYKWCRVCGYDNEEYTIGFSVGCCKKFVSYFPLTHVCEYCTTMRSIENER